MDTLGYIFWLMTFITPLFTLPLMWRIHFLKKPTRIVIGLVLAAILSFVFYHVSLSIIFREGMGPGE